MSFLQAYYTSCEKGLRGSKGFQINAASEGMDPALLQQIERLGLYVPPISAPSRPTAQEIERFPVSLIYQRLGDGCAVLTQAKYLGTDYSGRFGNYFSHSLVSRNPTQDIKGEGFLPIEMWQSETWETRESASTSIAPLERLSAGRGINLETIGEFLNENDRLQHLPFFLTAVELALGTGRRTIIVADSPMVALWIAVASYALPSHLALQLTFNTYVKNPYQSESLIVGTTPDSDFRFAQHEIDHQYCVFDFEGGRFTRLSEISSFATQVAAAYQNQHGEVVAGFSAFVEQVAPELSLEEIDAAFACHALISGFGGKGPDVAQIIRWCVGHLGSFNSKQINPLLSMFFKENPSSKTVEACTDLFLGSRNDGIQPEISQAIERSYIEWLVRDISASLPIDLLAETARRLPVSPAVASRAQPICPLWKKQVRLTAEPSRLCVLLQLGDKLGFLDEPDEIFRHLGKTIIGPVLSDLEVQRTTAQLADRPAMRYVLYGIGDYLATQVGQPQVFSAASNWLSKPEILHTLTQCAAERKDLNLYFRLMGARAACASGDPDARIEAYNQCLAAAGQFGIHLEAGHLDNAFAAVWQNNLPAMAEAESLLSFLQQQQATRTNIPARLADLLVISEPGLLDPKQKRLASRLSAKPACDTLGDRSAIVYCFHLAEALLQDREDSVPLLGETLRFMKDSSGLLNQMAKATIHGLIARRLIYVKDEEAHIALLIQASRNNDAAGLINCYARDVTASLARPVPGKEREVARLFNIWVATEKTIGFALSDKLLTEVLPRALQSWRDKDLEMVERALPNRTTARQRWRQWYDGYTSARRKSGQFERAKRWFGLK